MSAFTDEIYVNLDYYNTKLAYFNALRLVGDANMHVYHCVIAAGEARAALFGSADYADARGAADPADAPDIASHYPLNPDKHDMVIVATYHSTVAARKAACAAAAVAKSVLYSAETAYIVARDAMILNLAAAESARNNPLIHENKQSKPSQSPGLCLGCRGCTRCNGDCNR